MKPNQCLPVNISDLGTHSICFWSKIIALWVSMILYVDLCRLGSFFLHKYVSSHFSWHIHMHFNLCDFAKLMRKTQHLLNRNNLHYYQVWLQLRKTDLKAICILSQQSSNIIYLYISHICRIQISYNCVPLQS